MRSGRFFISDVLFIKCESKHSIDFYKKICYNVNATQLNISYLWVYYAILVLPSFLIP